MDARRGRENGQRYNALVLIPPATTKSHNSQTTSTHRLGNTDVDDYEIRFDTSRLANLRDALQHRLWREALDFPAFVVGGTVDETVVQPALATLPELERGRRYAVTAPE